MQEPATRSGGRVVDAIVRYDEVRQAAIVDNKLLSAALLHARRLQDARDHQRRNSHSLNKRQKRLPRARRPQATTLNTCQ